MNFENEVQIKDTKIAFKLSSCLSREEERVLFAFENEFIFNSFGYLFIDIQRPEIILGLLKVLLYWLASNG